MHHHPKDERKKYEVLAHVFLIFKYIDKFQLKSLKSVLNYDTEYLFK
jgi:hypothetical protein